MNKQLMKFTSLRGHGNLPPITSRRLGNIPEHLHFACRAYKSDGGEDDDDEDTATLLMKRIEKRTNNMLKGYAEKEQLDELALQFRSLLEGTPAKGKEPAVPGLPIEALRALADEKTGILSTVVNQGLEIQKLKNNIDALPADMSLRSQILGWQKSNKEAIDAIRTGESSVLPKPFKVNLDVRAVASPMLPATVMPNGSAYITKFGVAPGMIDTLRIEPTFWDYLKKSKTGLETYIWINKVAAEGEAAFIAPGIYKPGISFSAVAQSSSAKKIADSVKFATELMDDIDGFEAWVRDELMYAVMQKLSVALLSGVASSTAPAGILTLAVPYNDAFTGVETTNPNRYDVIAAAVTQLRKRFFKGQIVTFVNTTDETNMNLTKAVSQGQIFMPPSTGSIIVPEERIPVGTFLTVAVDYYKVLIYKDFEVRFGWENDDFTKNLVTGIGEMRIHQFVSNNHAGFAITDTFANVKTLITAPAVV